MFLLDVMQEEDDEAEHINGEDDGDVDAGVLYGPLDVSDRGPLDVSDRVSGTRRRAFGRYS